MRIALASLVAVVALSACTTAKQHVLSTAGDGTLRVEENQRQLIQSIRDSEARRIAEQDVDRPFVAGNSRPLAREVSMPEPLRARSRVTASFSRSPVDLTTATRQISEATGLMITATPDALMSPSAFAPRTGMTAPGGGGVPVASPAGMPVGGPPMVVLQEQDTPNWQLLDDVARQVNAAWRPTPTGAEFFRVDTRVFQLAGIPQVASTEASLGRNGGANAMFESKSKSSFETKSQNLIAGLKTSVDALLSVGGRAVFSDEHQTVVVTDTPANLERISAYIEKQNRSMSRRVKVLIEAIEVTAKDGADAGIDWSLIYQAANKSLSINPLADLASTAAGALTLTRTSGSLSGSNLVVKALSEVGTIVNRRTFPFVTTSGRPVTQALRSTFSYVDQVQATTLPTTGTTLVSQAPTVTQKDETVGTFVTIVPTAKDDGTIFLSVAYDVTTAQPLVPFTVGAGSAAITVQQKTIDGNGLIQELPVRSGQTVVVGGIDLYNGQDTERRLSKGSPLLLGGSNKTASQSTKMVLLVTALTEEGI